MGPIAVQSDFHIWHDLCPVPHIYRVKSSTPAQQGKSFPQYGQLFHRFWQVIHRSGQSIARYLPFA